MFRISHLSKRTGRRSAASVCGLFNFECRLLAHRVVSLLCNNTSAIEGKADSDAASTRQIYDGVDAPPTASMCQSGGVEYHLREASVSEVIIIGLDIAKHVFHAHGADKRGRAVFSKRISRGKLLDFFAAQPSCTVALGACGGPHHWPR